MIHGKDIIIYEGSDEPVAIAASKSCTIDKQVGTIETSSPASGTARSYASGRTDWVCTMNNLVLSVKDYMLRVGETYFITMGVRGSSTDTITGYAICTECNITGTVGNLAQGSFRFQGSDRDGTLPPQPGETGYDMTVDQVTAIVYNVVGDGYLSRLHNDTAQGLITFNAGAYIPTGQSLRIGDAYLTYDAQNKMIKVWDGTGNEVRGFYATGSVSALGAANGSGGGGGGGGDLDRAGLFNILTGVPQDANEWISAKFLKLGNGLTAANDGTLSISGAVTSVGLTMPTGFTVTGSPITSSGTLAVSLASGYKLLTSSTATPGTYTKVTVDTYGRVTGGTSLSKTDIPSLDYIPITGSDVIRGKLEPQTSASYDLGSSDYRWRHGYFSGTVYATTFDGNATSATKASKVIDSYNTSKEITITYAKAAQSSTSWLASWNGYELGSISPSSLTVGAATKDGAGNIITSKYVTLDTTQTISGAKTFSSSIHIAPGTWISESSADNGLLTYKPSNNGSVSSSQWGVGAGNCQGVIRSDASDLVHYRGGTNYNILDTNNAPRWTMWIYPESGSSGTFATNIASNTDLNNILDAGTYYCYSGNVAGTLSNTPYTAGNFRLWNIYNTGTNGASSGSWFSQLILAPNEGNLYIRSHSNNSFGGWHRFIKDNGGTMTGSLTFNANSLGIVCTNGTYRMTFMIGSGGTNRGIWDDGANQWVVMMTSSYHTILGWNSDSSVNPSRYVGIGTYSPTQKLHVSGNILATGSVTALSDMRQKTFLAGVNETMETLAELPIFYYKWKDKDRDEYMHIGSSAQAVHRIFPELVLGTDELSVDYGVLGTTIGILNSRALVTLEQRVTALESKLEERQ